MILGTHTPTRTKRARRVAIALLIVFLGDWCAPTAVWALSGGPQQPEFSGFEQASSTEMVDLFSGDFNYNLPLFEVDGYPVNMVYKGNSGMESEASWVGLGWSLNPGMISRTVRGIPDDFNGETVTEKHNQQKQYKYSMDASLTQELAGWETKNLEIESKLSLGGSLNFSSERGFYLGKTVGVSFSIGSNENENKDDVTGSLGLGVQLSQAASAGLSVVPSASIVRHPEYKATGSIGGSYSFNSRTWQQNLGISTNIAVPAAQMDRNARARIPINENSYFPYTKPSTTAALFGINTKAGLTVGILDGDLDIGGSVYIQRIKDAVSENNAYGYLHLQHAGSTDLLDFNRDGDAEVYYPGMKNLPPSALTYDLYTVMGQGINGMIRPHRRETGAFADPDEKMVADFQLNLGGEIASGQLIKVGGDISVNGEQFERSSWDQVHNSYGKFDGELSNTLEQSVYFTKAGEPNAVNQSHFDAISGMDEVTFGLLSEKSIELGLPFPTANQLDSTDAFQRHPRNEVFQTLDAQTAQHVGLDQSIKSYNVPYSIAPADIGIIDRVSSDRPVHQLSEITSTQTDGSRYVYGIPAMNLSKKDVTFNASGGTVSDEKWITYASGDNSTDNDNGNNHMFYSKEIEGYAHTYLMTAYLGPDYIDMTGDGVSDDDMGAAVKFNWTRTDDDFKWRSPVTGTSNMAWYNEGSLISKEDERATYTYGERENWMLHSIESKNYVAFFELDDRNDALGVTDENGALDTQNTGKKLKRIRLYAKKEWEDKGTDAQPVKTIEFFYDYSLCSGVPNNAYGAGAGTAEEHLIANADTLGKLTLRKVTMGYGNSHRSALSPYVFDYGYNPAYDPKKADRWGGYKGTNLDDIPFTHYPYVNESVPDDTLDQWASAWQMNAITLPSGAQINVTYESDEYSHVQNKRAQQMVQLKGIGTSEYYASKTSLLYTNSVSSSAQHRYLFIDKPEGVTDPEELVEGMDDWLYFRVKVRLTPINKSNKNYDYEYIRGYGKIASIGICPDSTDKVFINLTSVNYNDKGAKTNVILKSALDYIHLNHQPLIFGNIHPDDSQLLKSLKNSATILDDIRALFLGPYGLMVAKGMGKKVRTFRSFIRINHPQQRKNGGGHRVSRIEMTDQWNSQTTSEDGNVYGQTYDYDYQENGQTSGVASYEPMDGNDENPFKRPHHYPYDNSNSKKPKPEGFQEQPFGELFYPSGNVGYAEVTVRNLRQNGYKSTGSYTTNAFYTAKDFPILVENTRLRSQRDTKKPLWAWLGYGETEYTQATSQGYVLRFNDMHGKPRSTTTYYPQTAQTASASVISSTEYIYFTENDSTLSNVVRCADRTGTIVDTLIGIDYDINIDNTYSRAQKMQSGLLTNLSTFLIPATPPVPVSLPFPPVRWSNQNYQYRTVVVTKIIQQYGILKEIRHQDRSLFTTVSNEVFDAHTGTPILTKTKTEYNLEFRGQGRADEQFELTYPAYMAQGNDRMGHAYRNIDYRGEPGAFVEFLSASDYNALSTGQQDTLKEIIYRGFLDGLSTGCSLYTALSGNLVQAGVFAEGDEVYDKNDSKRYWVAEVVTAEDLALINGMTGEGGNAVSDSGAVGAPPIVVPPPGSGQVISLCGDSTLSDTNFARMYASVLNLTQVPALQNYTMLNSIPVSPSVKTSLGTYTGVAHNQNWFAIWNQPGAADFYTFLDWFTSNDSLRGFLAGLDGADVRVLMDVLQCSNLRNCLEMEVSNTVLLQALDELLSDTDLWQFTLEICQHYDEYYTAVAGDAGADSCTLSGDSGSYYDGTCTYDMYTYEHMLNQGFSFLSAGVQGGCSGNVIDIAKAPCNFFSESLPTVTLAGVTSCPTLGSLPDSNIVVQNSPGPNTTTDNQDYAYNQPDSNELVMFVDRVGNIMDLNGHLVRIIRSGRRNIQSASAGSEISLNSNAIDPTQVTGSTTTGVLAANAVTYTDDWPSDFFGADTSHHTFNPFVFGQRGIFRPEMVYAPSGSRDYSASLNSRNDGTIEDYVPFWEFESGNYASTSRASDPDELWIRSEQFTKYSGLGGDLESKNPLDIFSAMLYEHNNMVSAEAVNAFHTDLFFESFEDYDIGSGLRSRSGLLSGFALDNCTSAACNSWIDIDSATAYLTQNDAHAGLQCLYLRGSYGSGGDPYYSLPYGLRCQVPFSMGDNCYDSELYRIPGFVPEAGKRYVISLWVKAVLDDATGYSPLDDIAEVTVSMQGLSTFDSVFTPSGPMIDGWMRIEGAFTAPSSTENLFIELEPGAYGAYFDDLRIYPVPGKMLTYVQHPSKMRMQAALDENNYAMFYKYDHDGSLMKVERETESGRLTLKESTKANARNN